MRGLLVAVALLALLARADAHGDDYDLITGVSLGVLGGILLLLLAIGFVCALINKYLHRMRGYQTLD